MSDLSALGGWPLAFAALVVPVLAWLSGHLVLRLIANDPTQSPSLASAEGTSRLESACMTLAAGLSMLCWVAVLLAELGQLGLGTVCAVLAVVCVIVALIPKPATTAVSSSARPVAALVLPLLSVTVVAAVLYLPAFPTVLWASDSTVYLSYGRQIGTTGSLVLADPLLADLEPETRATLFENPTAGDMTGTHARLPGGFLIPEPAEPVVTAGFSPLFPVLMALSYQLLGVQGMLLVTPLFAVMSLGVLLLVGARLHSTLAGVLATAMLAVSAPQIWFAKFSLPATVAQFFILSGLLTLLVALTVGRTRLAVLAGWLFGMAMFAKFDLVAILPVAMLSLLLVAGFSPRLEHRRVVGYLGLGLVVPLVHNAIHYLAFPSHYTPFLGRMLSSSLTARPVFLAGVVMAIGLLVAAWRMRTGPWNGVRWLVGVRGRTVMLSAILGVYALNYLRISDNHLGYTVRWIGWYLSWPVVGLLVAAVFFAIRRWHRHHDISLMIVLVLLATASWHYFYDPHEPAELIWSMRRFVPLVLPLSLLLVSVLLASMLRQLQRSRRWVSAVVCLVLVAAVARPSLAFLGGFMWAGAVEQTTQLAQLFPNTSVILVGPTLSGTHLQTSMTYLHDRPAVVLQPEYDEPRFLEDVVRRWLETGTRVFLVVGEQDGVSTPGLSATPRNTVSLALPMLEATLSTRPTRVITRTAELHVFELARTETPRRVFDVGTPGDDVVFGLRGFHGAETDPDPQKGTYRWTGAEASVRVPATPEIRVTWDGWRPEGAAPARVSLWLDGLAVLEEVVLSDTPSTFAITNPAAERDKTTELRLLSSVFVPQDAGLSADRRQLGARVYRLEFTGFE